MGKIIMTLFVQINEGKSHSIKFIYFNNIPLISSNAVKDAPHHITPYHPRFVLYP